MLDTGMKIPKKIGKKFKKIKNLFPALFLAKTGWDRLGKRDKNFSPEFRSNSTRLRKFPKKLRKISKKLKNLCPALFLAKTGWERMRKRKKNFSPEFRSYSTRARKFRKKKQKNSKLWKTSFRHYFEPKRDKIGWERQKKKKKISPEFHSYSTWARKFRKN